MRPKKRQRKRTECEVQRLGREVTNDVGSVATPERDKALILVCTGEAIDDTLVRSRKAALLDLKECQRVNGKPRKQVSAL